MGERPAPFRVPACLADADNPWLRHPSVDIPRDEMFSDGVKADALDMLKIFGVYKVGVGQKPNMVGLHLSQLDLFYPKEFKREMLMADFAARKGLRPDNYTPRPRMFMNTKIVEKSKETDTYIEGCFSLNRKFHYHSVHQPDDTLKTTDIPSAEYGAIVTRPRSITIEAWEVDIDALLHEGVMNVTFVREQVDDPYTARIIQHEVEHGKGIRYMDHVKHRWNAFEIDNWPLFRKTWNRLRPQGAKRLAKEDFLKLKKMSLPMTPGCCPQNPIPVFELAA